MIKLVVATRNAHKTREIQEVLGSEFQVIDLSDRGDVAEIAETGRTFAQNARLKAISVSTRISGLVLADDSGLEVDALGGAPGIFSARYAGECATDEQNVAKLLAELERLGPSNNHRARFQCVLVLAGTGESIETFTGTVEGTITSQLRGEAGFGYDPIFVPNGYQQTFAELPARVKNQISHRGQALQKLKRFLTTGRHSE